jgi:hypothetical protein
MSQHEEDHDCSAEQVADDSETGEQLMGGDIVGCRGRLPGTTRVLGISMRRKGAKTTRSKCESGDSPWVVGRVHSLRERVCPRLCSGASTQLISPGGIRHSLSPSSPTINPVGAAGLRFRFLNFPDNYVAILASIASEVEDEKDAGTRGGAPIGALGLWIWPE